MKIYSALLNLNTLLLRRLTVISTVCSNGDLKPSSGMTIISFSGPDKSLDSMSKKYSKNTTMSHKSLA